MIFSLLMAAKLNCASAWANHTTGRSAQNGTNRTATLDTFADCELFATSLLRRRQQVGNVDTRRDNHVKLLQTFITVRMNITDDQGSGALLMNTGETPFIVC
jgi:hypothetical protein